MAKVVSNLLMSWIKTRKKGEEESLYKLGKVTLKLKTGHS